MLLLNMFVVGTTSISAQKQEPVVESVNTSQYSLSTDSIDIIASTRKLNEIKVGESNNTKEIKIALEKKQKEEAIKLAEAQRNTVARENRVYSDPSDFDTIYKAAENATGVDWRLLKAIHTIETGASGSTTKRNPSGATGPMQFLPSTWKHYGVDGNGDGIADITNVNDAIFSAANYLKACGYPNIKSALWGYNPSTRYYTKVMTKAQSFGL